MADIDESELLQLTGKLVSFPSSDPPGDESEIGRFVSERLRRSDVPFEVETEEVRPGRENVMAKVGDPDRGSILLNGHLDVVPADPSRWSGDPFEMRIGEERIVGRGVSDMKGSLAAKILATESYISDHERPGEVQLAFVVGEERDGFGTEKLVESRIGTDGVIVGEPTDMRICTAQKGTVRYEITVLGESSHSGRPDKGKNAIDGARMVLTGLATLNETVAQVTHPLMTPGSVTVTELSGGVSHNIIPPRAEITLDCRLVPGSNETPESFDSRIKNAISDARRDFDVEIDRWSFSAPMEIPRDAEIATALGSAVSRAGRVVEFAGFNATTDARHFVHELNIPAVLFGPGSIDNDAHTVDESVRIADLVDTARVYQYAIEEFLTDS